jgi:hypothetical protein
MIAPMLPLIGSRGAAVATTLGLATALSLVACSWIGTPDAPREEVGCLLWQSHGNLVAEDGRPVFRSIQHDIPPDPLPLDLPDGWEIRATDAGQFEVLDDTGAVRAVTGTRVVVLGDADPDTPAVTSDGALEVCAIDPYPMGPDVEEAP